MLAAFTTVFLAFGLGFAVQRLRPLSEGTLKRLSGLVVGILLPLYLFSTTATSASLESLSVAPALVAMGIAVPLASYLLATLALKPSGVAQEQRSAFRFSVTTANTAFLGIPICAALFGPLGAIYAVLYDFGTTLVALTLGIWELKGGHLDDWRPLAGNPLIWSVLLGLGWALLGWPFPTWIARPCRILGDVTLLLALLVGSAQIASIRSSGLTWRRPFVGLITARLVAVPLIVGGSLIVIGWLGLPAKVTIMQSAMPVGLTAAIFAEHYGADAKFAAAATLWSTLVAMISLPLIAGLLI